jgi:hypothetical protein
MKKSYLKKIIKSIKSGFKNGVKESRHYYETPTALKKRKRNSNELFCEFDQEISEKFYKFILAIFKFRDILSFELNDESIGIYGDLNRMITKSNSNNGSYQSEDIIDIKISKEGFSFKRNYGFNISFSDIEMFEKLKVDLREKNEIYSKSRLIESIDEISILTNVVRELNLDNLISSFGENK